MRIFFTTLVFLCFSAFTSAISAQDGYDININIENFQNDTLLLGYQYADKQYIKDTVLRTAAGFVFKGDEALICGIYLVIMPPENRYFQLLIDDTDQTFRIQTNAEKPVENIQITGSEENQLFYEYLQFLGQQGPKAKKLNEEIQGKKEKNEDTKSLESDLEKINQSVEKYQFDLMASKANSMTARIIRASREIDIPDFDTKTEEGKRERFNYLRSHWFDNTDLNDPCLLRTSLIHKRVDNYLEKLTAQHPDSLAMAVDRIVRLSSGNEETKKHWLSTMLNKYATTKVIGMDAVYVYIVMKYYATGETPWVEDKKLLEIVDDATKLEPILIGKIAPEIEIPLLDIEGTIKASETAEEEGKKFVLGDKVSLHQVDSPYKVLFMWAPDCGHCKKSMPKIIEFYDKFKDKGVEIYAICHQNYKKTPDCATFIKERPGMMNWINVTDPYFRSKYQTLYDVRSTPQIYILDRTNEIIMKRLGSDQLEDVMNEIFKREEIDKNK